MPPPAAASAGPAWPVPPAPPSPPAARLARLAGSVRRLFPLTTRGLLVAALSAAAFVVWGRRETDYVLHVAGMAGLGLTALAMLLVSGCAVWARPRLRDSFGPARRLEATTPQRSGFEAPSLAAVPLVTMSWRCIAPPGLGVRLHPEGQRLAEELRATRRTHVEGIHREFCVEDVFGLASVRLRGFERAALTVMPDPGHLTRMPVLQAISGGDVVPNPRGRPEGDRMDIRQYVAGDSVRNILWKAYARTRELNVRVHERAIAPTRRLVAYLVRGAEDEAAAAAARVALEKGLLGPRWAFGADGTPGLLEDLDRALLAVAKSAVADVEPGRGLAAFLDEAMRDGRARCLVFLPPLPGPSLQAAVSVAQRNPGTLSFVIGTDGVRAETPAPLWRRVVEAPVDDARPTAAQLGEVLRTLASVGCEAVVVDRSTGRFYGQEHRQVWEARAV